MRQYLYLIVFLLVTVISEVTTQAQEKSVRPGINDSFLNPDIKDFVGRFEVESREVFLLRRDIVAACEIEEGQTVADIGAGTGLFTRLFSEAVGRDGQVIAVDIAPKFLEHIAESCRQAGLRNVDTLLCKADSSELPPESVDVAFICDTYHHFEFPEKTMDSIYRALKPGGRLILIDFHRDEEKSSEWILSHVRAGQEVFEREIADTGLRKIREDRELLAENYFVVFEKPLPGIGPNQPDQASGPGRGMRQRRGMGRELRADQEIFHFLLGQHTKIRRSVKHIDHGVETLTESDDPMVAAKIQEHVESMHERLKSGHGFRLWDELFFALFKNYDKIEMVVENTEKGVRVTETSGDRDVVALIQAHAEIVSLFVKHGFDEAHKNHAVPTTPRESSKLLFPLIENFGGVLPRPQAAQQPKPGAKVVFDITTDSKPMEVNKGLDRVARFLNLYGVAGTKASDLKITVVVHGEATKSVLKDADYQRHFDAAGNPNLALIEKLKDAGVEIFVCGQALSYKNFADHEVADDIQIAMAALTAIVNKQSDGYSYILIP